MFCRNCGADVKDAPFCGACGASQKPYTAAPERLSPQSAPMNEAKVLSLIGMIFGIFAAAGAVTLASYSSLFVPFAITGLVLSIIGASVSRKIRCKSPMATTGIICSIVGMVMPIVWTIVGIILYVLYYVVFFLLYVGIYGAATAGSGVYY